MNLQNIILGISVGFIGLTLVIISLYLLGTLGYTVQKPQEIAIEDPVPRHMIPELKSSKLITFDHDLELKQILKGPSRSKVSVPKDGGYFAILKDPILVIYKADSKGIYHVLTSSKCDIPSKFHLKMVDATSYGMVVIAESDTETMVVYYQDQYMLKRNQFVLEGKTSYVSLISRGKIYIVLDSNLHLITANGISNEVIYDSIQDVLFSSKDCLICRNLSDQLIILFDQVRKKQSNTIIQLPNDHLTDVAVVCNQNMIYLISGDCQDILVYHITSQNVQFKYAYQLNFTPSWIQSIGNSILVGCAESSECNIYDIVQNETLKKRQKLMISESHNIACSNRPNLIVTTTIHNKIWVFGQCVTDTANTVLDSNPE
jgi:hypothetical protein